MTEENTILSQTKLFVGGLDWSIRGKELADIFAVCGEVMFARVKLDKDTKKSRGFGFVEFANASDAAKALKEMDGKEIKWRAIRVGFAKENPDKLQKPEEVIE